MTLPEEKSGAVKILLTVLSWALILLGLFIISQRNYLLFHTTTEVFSIVIACGIFMITWNSRFIARNNYLLFLGIAYLFVSAVDLTHTMAYKGMGVFKEGGSNMATQLWISSRYLESLSLLAALVFVRRKLNSSYLLIGYTVITTLLLVSIFYGNAFPPLLR